MKFPLRIISLLGGLLGLIGCSGVDMLNAIIPSSGYTVTKDIAYGTDERQKLDVYVPDSASADTPAILFFYGGSWKSGSKDDYRFVGQAFASKGYIAVIADYRVYPKAYFPDFMHDSAKALAWVHANIADFKGDPKNIFVAGHSAGAYNAVLLTLDERYIKAEGGSQSWIKGTIGLAGPYDFLPMTDKDVIAVFSKVNDADTQPINYARKNLPPMLLLTGDADTEVLPRNTKNLSAKLRELGNNVTVKTYPDLAHIGIVLSLANGFRGKAPTLEDIDSFIKHTRTN